MWIEMLETYAGPPGLFLKGEKRDVPESIAKQIAVKGKKLWRRCDPPRLGDGMFPNVKKPEQPAVHAGKGQKIPDEVKR